MRHEETSTYNEQNCAPFLNICIWMLHTHANTNHLDTYATLAENQTVMQGDKQCEVIQIHLNMHTNDIYTQRHAYT